IIGWKPFAPQQLLSPDKTMEALLRLAFRAFFSNKVSKSGYTTESRGGQERRKKYFYGIRYKYYMI
ncbi:MAG: hypothetical protein LBL37_01905, partial [Gracilibacteraceae bacterium]|nr:hypothetical protein [Gracilibacteraceae bacterium]